MNGNKPTARFRAGGISVALWTNTMKTNDHGQVETLSATLDRRYKDRDGNWKSSSSFRLNDLPKVMYVLTKAYDFMVTQGQPDSETIVSEAVR